MTHHINQLTRYFLPLATDTNLLFKDKINLVAKTKISICYNLVHVLPDHLKAIKSHHEYQKSEAFSTLDNWKVMPQFKTRVHEAAISKTLNLIRKDEWNVVEEYYKPDEDFIYFEDERDLKNKINEISNDWSNYESIIESAYEKSLNYTTENFIEKIKKEVNK